MREVIITSILQGLDKKFFFDRCSLFKFNNLGMALGVALKFYSSMANRFKLKVLGINFYLCRSYRGITDRVSFALPAF